MILYIVEIFVSVFVLIIGIGFITLLERNYIGYSQTRKRPNKIGIHGIFQSIIDGIKLFIKIPTSIYTINIEFQLSLRDHDNCRASQPLALAERVSTRLLQ